MALQRRLGRSSTLLFRVPVFPYLLFRLLPGTGKCSGSPTETPRLANRPQFGLTFADNEGALWLTLRDNGLTIGDNGVDEPIPRASKRYTRSKELLLELIDAFLGKLPV